jgi:hypothetical protein
LSGAADDGNAEKAEKTRIFLPGAIFRNILAVLSKFLDWGNNLVHPAIPGRVASPVGRENHAVAIHRQTLFYVSKKLLNIRPHHGKFRGFLYFFRNSKITPKFKKVLIENPNFSMVRPPTNRPNVWTNKPINKLLKQTKILTRRFLLWRPRNERRNFRQFRRNFTILAQHHLIVQFYINIRVRGRWRGKFVVILFDFGNSE